MIPTNDTPVLERAQTLFRKDDTGHYLSTAFGDLDLALRIAKNRKFWGCSATVGLITQDVFNVAALVTRLEWMRGLALSGELHSETWRSFSSLDIEHFFIQTRSAMDHVAELLRCFLAKGGQFPGSFRKLRQDINKFKGRLPDGIINVIESAGWFDQMRTIRDSLVHDGGRSLIFLGPMDGILFQVYRSDVREGFISDQKLMYNENIVHFEKYAALLFAHLLSFLDDVAAKLFEADDEIIRVGAVKTYHSGFNLLDGWMKNLLNQGVSQY